MNIFGGNAEIFSGNA